MGWSILAKMRVAIVFATLWVFSLGSYADSETTINVADVLQKHFPYHEPNPDFIAVGDLNGDGVSEVATLLGDPSYNRYQENDAEIRIVVLKGTKRDDEFTKAAVSPALPRDPNVQYFLRINNGSLFLLTSGRGFSNDYQFQMRKEQLLLVGEELKTYDPSESSMNWSRSSFNYLTGQLTSSKKSSGRYQEKTCKFATKKLHSIVEFDLANESFRTRPGGLEICP